MTDTEIFLTVPIFEVVAALVAVACKVADLILPISAEIQIFDGVFIHFKLGVLVGQIESASLFKEGGILFDLESVE